MKKVLANSQKKPPKPPPMSNTLNGAAQPPRNMIDATQPIRIMLAYSASMNMAYDMPEYSTMWPATISDSPSTTSNGWRLHSARPEVR